MTFWQEIITLTCLIRRGMKFAAQISPLINLFLIRLKYSILENQKVYHVTQLSYSKPHTQWGNYVKTGIKF